MLGDDAVRDRRLAVGVVAAEDAAVTLRVSPQKLLASLDPLTLRLFSRLRQQQDNALQVGRRGGSEVQRLHQQQQAAAATKRHPSSRSLRRSAAAAVLSAGPRACCLAGGHHCGRCRCHNSFGRMWPTTTTAEAAPSRRPTAVPAAGHICRGHPQHTCSGWPGPPTAAAPPCVEVHESSRRQPRRGRQGAGHLSQQQPSHSKGRAPAAVPQLTGPAACCEAVGQEGRRRSSCRCWRADSACCVGGAAACRAQGGPVYGAATDAVCQAACGGEALSVHQHQIAS